MRPRCCKRCDPGALPVPDSTCWRKTPPTAGHPLLDLDLPNFILTPHIAWSGRAAMQALADQLIDNIEAFVAGTPNNRVA